MEQARYALSPFVREIFLGDTAVAGPKNLCGRIVLVREMKLALYCGDTMLNFLVLAFPLWVLLASILSFIHPPLFTWFTGNFITWGLGVIMLGMGITLSVEDFKRVFKFPKLVLLGVGLQYLVMPFMGVFSAWLYKLPPHFAVGLILVACCPGGTASNVVSYLAKADVALSVTMTSISTFVAIILTPALTAWLAGSRIHVDAWGLFFSTVQVVVIPIVLGVLCNRFFPRLTQKILPVAPLVAVLTITLIVASIVGAGKQAIIDSGAILMLSVFTLHAGGFLWGYILSKLISKNEIASRTISIEVGMQNSGLGVVLARLNFANPLVAIPSAISSLFHSLIASLLAGIWRLDAGRHQS